MAKHNNKRKIKIIIITLFFITYFIFAARPIPRETVIVHNWISSIDLETTGIPAMPPDTITPAAAPLLPYILGPRFGYVDTSGNFAINRTKQGKIYLSKTLWTEHEIQPARIEINNTASETVLVIENPGGYPILLDNRIFIIGNEQNTLTEFDINGNLLWTYEFGAPLTSIDAAAGLVLTGSIDGIIEILDSQGRRAFFFEPGGSRYSIILGTAISSDGSRIGIISGIDRQRFLLLERFGTRYDYRVVFHEFLESDFRRPVHISFIDQDRRIVFELHKGLGCFNIRTRQLINIPLKGEVIEMDNYGGQGFFFLITSHSPGQNELIGIRFPQDNRITAARLRRDVNNLIFLRASFTSDDVFLGRNSNFFVTGGGTTLISFVMEEK